MVDIRPLIRIPLRNINFYNNPYYSIVQNSYVTWRIPTIIAMVQHKQAGQQYGCFMVTSVAVLLLWADHKAAEAAMDHSTL